jgi:hypothetical protein
MPFARARKQSEARQLPGFLLPVRLVSAALATSRSVAWGHSGSSGPAARCSRATSFRCTRCWFRVPRAAGARISHVTASGLVRHSGGASSTCPARARSAAARALRKRKGGNRDRGSECSYNKNFRHDGLSKDHDLHQSEMPRSVPKAQ